MGSPHPRHAEYTPARWGKASPMAVCFSWDIAALGGIIDVPVTGEATPPPGVTSIAAEPPAEGNAAPSRRYGHRRLGTAEGGPAPHARRRHQQFLRMFTRESVPASPAPRHPPGVLPTSTRRPATADPNPPLATRAA